MFQYIRTRPRFFITIFCVLMLFVVWKEEGDLSPRGVLTVAFFDVGQGDAIFIETPEGRQILVDGGPNGAVMKRLGQRMSFFDRSIDMLVVTNPDKDHIAGFVDVLEYFDVGIVVEPGTQSKTQISKEVTKLIEQETQEDPAARIYARRGMDFLLDTDLHLTILFPDRDVSTLSTNEGSIVAKLVYKNTSLLLTGDTVENIEKYLVDMDQSVASMSPLYSLNSDILKVAHHGSNTSTSKEFLDAVSPDIAIVSAGEDNRYGHPHEEVMKRFFEKDIKIFGTYNEGTIIFQSDGETWWRQ